MSRQITENNGRRFIEYPCSCGTPSCERRLAIAPGVPKGTISLGIRQHGQTVAQVYISIEDVALLIQDLASPAGSVLR